MFLSLVIHNMYLYHLVQCFNYCVLRGCGTMIHSSQFSPGKSCSIIQVLFQVQILWQKVRLFLAVRAAARCLILKAVGKKVLCSKRWHLSMPQRPRTNLGSFEMVSGSFPTNSQSCLQVPQPTGFEMYTLAIKLQVLQEV